MSEFEQLAKSYENENNVLVKLDEMEENIQLADKITKEYNEIKKQIKAKMLEYGKENNLEQIKWVTPKGIKITLSIGKEEETKIEQVKQFSEELLKEKYPNIYEECCITKDKEIIIKNASNDRLIVTMPKGDE